MLTNFNSIKVRLEPLFSLGRDTLTEFQFHKGTIRTYQFPQKMSTDCLFQFHKGTIRTEDIYLFYFVRLFQFHKGTIRTVYSLPTSSHAHNFNSIKVRLEPKNIALLYMFRVISIP